MIFLEILSTDYKYNLFENIRIIDIMGLFEMKHEKTKIVLLLGLISLILVLFVPGSKIFFALLIGLLFVIPILALLALVFVGKSTLSKT